MHFQNNFTQFVIQQEFAHFFAIYLFFSYVKGHILLTWDLGAGPRRIFTKRPVDERYFVHSVQFGRYGRLGYLQVDNFPNITGRAPGLRENLNITSKVKMSIFIIWRIQQLRGQEQNLLEN